MARKTREEKIIDHATATIDDLENLYNNDGRAVIEYTYLIKENASKQISKNSIVFN